MAESNQRSMEIDFEPVKRQYAQAKEWVQDRSPLQLVLLIVGPILVLSLIGFAIYRVFGGKSASSRSRSTRRTQRGRSRSRATPVRTNTRSRRRNGSRSTLATATT